MGWLLKTSDAVQQAMGDAAIISHHLPALARSDPKTEIFEQQMAEIVAQGQLLQAHQDGRLGVVGIAPARARSEGVQA
ncbi:MAG: hypothetical protein FJ060_04185 [Cyanobacteria bacterium K_Offshore_0m_m2_072]|nr:hypothetical protein [Cyanobacteria bacterium K_Offshore_0m_m2_072]